MCSFNIEYILIGTTSFYLHHENKLTLTINKNRLSLPCELLSRLCETTLLRNNAIYRYDKGFKIKIKYNRVYKTFAASVLNEK